MPITEWKEQWEGVSLPGDHVLEKCTGGDDHAAFFETSPGPDGRRTIIQLVPDTGASQLDRWNRIRQLRHPNLVALLDCGRAALGNEIVLYAVFEAPDDTLGQAELTPQQALEVRDSALDALRYLHNEGLVIGALNFNRIVAVDDRIMLATDAVRPAAGAGDFAQDLRVLDQLIPPPAVPVPPPVASPVAPPVTSPVKTPVPVAAEPAIPYTFPKWIIVGAAALLLLILGLNLRRPPATEPPAGITPATSTVPVPSTPLDPEPVAPRSTKPSPVRGKEVWRVIAFTYHTQEAAAKKVHQLNQLHPDLHATVFPMKSRRDFLVSLGGPMSHEDAIRVQHSARGKGLPRDLYVQNFTQP